MAVLGTQTRLRFASSRTGRAKWSTTAAEANYPAKFASYLHPLLRSLRVSIIQTISNVSLIHLFLLFTERKLILWQSLVRKLD
jgi:hypothetical protein